MKNNVYGYVRVSTKEQNEARQVIAMHEFGVDEQNVCISFVKRYTLLVMPLALRAVFRTCRPSRERKCDTGWRFHSCTGTVFALE